MQGLQEITNALSNGPIPDPYGLLFPKIGGSQSHPKLQSLLPQEWVVLQTSNLVGTFTGVHPNKSPL